MIPKTNEDIIIDLLKELREDNKAIRQDISDINSNLVGRKACDEYRRELWDELAKLRKICQEYELCKSALINTSELSTSERKVYDQVQNELINPILIKIDERFNEFDKNFDQKLKSRVFDFGWSVIKDNRVVQSMFGLLIFIAVMVTGGRSINIYELAQQYGWQAVETWIMVVTLIIFLLFIIVWLIVNRNKVSEKAMMIFSMVIR